MPSTGAGPRHFLRLVTGPVASLTAAWAAAVALVVSQEPRQVVFVALGVLGSFVAGLVGIGGGIIMFPLLLYVPPLLGQPTLAVHTVTGVTMLQVTAAALAGAAGHAHRGQVRPDLVTSLGGGMVVGSLTGSFLSGWIAAPVLVAVFASLALAAAVAMFLPSRWMPPDEPAADFRLRRGVAFGSGLVTGGLVGLVGAGGGFLLIPLMLYVLRVPLRACVGASLAIVLVGGIAGLTGKVATGQVDWHIGLASVSGALPGAWAGAAVSARTGTRTLGRLLGVVLGLVAVKMWWEILAG